MHRRQLLFTILKSIAVGLVAGRSSSAQDDLDPVKLMPDTHKVLFENAFVRVIEGRVPAGGVEPKHRHPHCVLVNLADFDVEVSVSASPSPPITYASSNKTSSSTQANMKY